MSGRSAQIVLFYSWFKIPECLSLYLTIIPRARVGYEVMDSQRGA